MPACSKNSHKRMQGNKDLLQRLSVDPEHGKTNHKARL
jgi:hypothetical protein